MSTLNLDTYTTGPMPGGQYHVDVEPRHVYNWSNTEGAARASSPLAIRLLCRLPFLLLPLCRPWQRLTTAVPLRLLRWTHVAAIFFGSTAGCRQLVCQVEHALGGP